MAAWLATRERPLTVHANNYADFSINAAKLLLDPAKPHVLLHHAKTQLRLQAVAALLDKPCAAQQHITCKYRWLPPTRLRVSV